MNTTGCSQLFKTQSSGYEVFSRNFFCIILSSFFSIEKRISVKKYNINTPLWTTLDAFLYYESDSTELLITPYDYKGSLSLKRINKRTKDTLWTKYFCGNDFSEIRTVAVPDLGKDPTGLDGILFKVQYRCLIPVECADSIFIKSIKGVKNIN